MEIDGSTRVKGNITATEDRNIGIENLSAELRSETVSEAIGMLVHNNRRLLSQRTRRGTATTNKVCQTWETECAREGKRAITVSDLTEIDSGSPTDVAYPGPIAAHTSASW